MDFKDSQYRMTCGKGKNAVSYMDGAETAWLIFSKAVTYAYLGMNEFPVRLYDNESGFLIAEVVS